MTANCVACGYIDTLVILSAGAESELLYRGIAALSIPATGRPKDVAAAVTFLASPAASWITGQTYPVNWNVLNGSVTGPPRMLTGPSGSPRCRSSCYYECMEQREEKICPIGSRCGAAGSVHPSRRRVP